MSFQLTAEGEHASALAGDWLVRATGPGEWRTVADAALDESGWQATITPGRWWLDPGLGDERSVLYRRRFRLPGALVDELPGGNSDSPSGGLTSGVPERSGARRGGANSGDRRWLLTSGLCDLGHLWLDGAYLGDLRGRHPEHAFEVSEMLASGGEHLLAAEASSSAVRAPRSAGAAVRLERTGPARIERIRALVIEANPDRAVLRIAATVDSAGTHRADITTTVLPAGDTSTGHRDASLEGQQATPGNGLARAAPILARGPNELSWLVAIEQPTLWWPAGMGQQARYRIDVNVSIDGATSHSVHLATGIRAVAIRRGKLVVNGEAQHAGLDALITVPHELAHRSVYDAADAAGTLLCQQITLDPAVFAGAERGRRALAARAAAVAADHAGHHPSVVAWQLAHPSSGRRRIWRGSWADRTARRAKHAADPTRPVLSPTRSQAR